VFAAMPENPYAPPGAEIADVPVLVTAGAPPAADVEEGPLYARIRPRMWAFLVDYFLLLVVFALLAFVGAQLESVPRLRAALLLAWILLAILYEPIMVARTGATVGHHLNNICVVVDATERAPGFLRALARSLTKGLLGGLSFLWMMGSERQQAIHDAITGVTVRIRDPRFASRRHYVRRRRRRRRR
jgi:uncharacterized RDD family membrane protein YckC